MQECRSLSARRFATASSTLRRFKEQIEFQIAAGTKCICPVGTTGESPTLSHEEHERVIATACAKSPVGRIKVMPGDRLEQHARGAAPDEVWRRTSGADAALVVAPYYNKPTQEGFYQHFKALAEAVGTPICVYNIPGRTGKNIEPETIARLAELPNVTMVKEATGSLDQASQILSLSNLTVLSGDDSLTLPLMSIGGRGVISVVGNIVPQDMIALVHAFDTGRSGGRGALAPQAVSPVPRHAGTGDKPDPDQGGDEAPGPRHGELRLPMTPLDAASEGMLRKTLGEYGLL